MERGGAGGGGHRPIVLLPPPAISEFDQGLSEDIDNLIAGSSVGDDGGVIAPALTDTRATRAYSGKYWEIYDPKAGPGMKEPVPSRSLWDQILPTPPHLADALAKARSQTLYYDAVGPLKQPLRVAARMIVLPGRPNPAVFLAAEDRSPINRDIRQFDVTTAIALFLLGVGLVAAVVVQVRVGLVPLFDMGRDVGEVRRGRAQRLTRPYPKELSPLASELNALLDHNQEVVERQRTHVGNLAHALKTPISVILAEAETTPGPLSAIVARQAEAMRAHVEHHLRRARAAARLQGSGERTPVAPVLAELARTLERFYQDKGVLVEWEAPDDLAFPRRTAGPAGDRRQRVGETPANGAVNSPPSPPSRRGRRDRARRGGPSATCRRRPCAPRCAGSCLRSRTESPASDRRIRHRRNRRPTACARSTWCRGPRRRRRDDRTSR